MTAMVTGSAMVLSLFSNTSPVDAKSKPTPIQRFFETFESNVIPQGWEMFVDADGNWQTTDSEAKTGRYSLMASAQNGQKKISIQWRGYLPAGTLSFDYKMNTLMQINTFDFYVNASQALNESGTQDWTFHQQYLKEGYYFLKWELTLGSGQSNFIDKVWLDNVLFAALTLDSDSDGLTDRWEYNYGLNFDDPADVALDSDSDGLSNLTEFQLFTEPNNPDTDYDGLTDGEEVNTYGTKVRTSDTDGDRMFDGWEVRHGLDPLVNNGQADHDNDGFSNWVEYDYHTNPTDADSKPQTYQAYQQSFERLQTQLPDQWYNHSFYLPGWTIDNTQASKGKNSLKSAQGVAFSSSLVWKGEFEAGTMTFDYLLEPSSENSLRFYVNGLQQAELRPGQKSQWQTATVTLPNKTNRLSFTANGVKTTPAVWLDNVRFYVTGRDGDGDGMTDEYEIKNGFDFNDGADGYFDADADGLTNRTEAALGTDPRKNDSDDDGLIDGHEVDYFATDPLLADSDQDTMPDGWETANQLNPLSAVDATMDKDNDGYSNLHEFRFGSSPIDALSKPAIITSLNESFETAVSTLGLHWQTPVGVSNNWQIDLSQASAGKSSLKSGKITHEQHSTIEFIGFFSAGTLSFDVLGSSESGFDFFTFYVDGQQVANFSGQLNWQTMSTDLTNGLHALRFEYAKDASVSGGLDAIWLDNLRYKTADSDNDGLPDGWEITYQLDNTNAADAAWDPDKDGLSNLLEYQHKTNPPPFRHRC